MKNCYGNVKTELIVHLCSAIDVVRCSPYYKVMIEPLVVHVGEFKDMNI